MKPEPITWGWWEPKRRAQWPKVAGHEKNFVLTPEEVKEYADLMTAMHELLTKEANAARYTISCLTGRIPGKSLGYNNEPPRLHSLGSILEFVVNEGKHRLKLQQFLLNVTRRAKSESSDSAGQQDAGSAPAVGAGTADRGTEGEGSQPAEVSGSELPKAP